MRKETEIYCKKRKEHATPTICKTYQGQQKPICKDCQEPVMETTDTPSTYRNRQEPVMARKLGPGDGWKYPVDSKCAVKGCGHRVTARGFCRNHYQADYNKRKQPKKTGICALPGCDTKAITRGYCRTHYWRILRKLGLIAMDAGLDKQEGLWKEVMY